MLRECWLACLISPSGVWQSSPSTVITSPLKSACTREIFGLWLPEHGEQPEPPWLPRSGHSQTASSNCGLPLPIAVHLHSHRPTTVEVPRLFPVLEVSSRARPTAPSGSVSVCQFWYVCTGQEWKVVATWCSWSPSVVWRFMLRGRTPSVPGLLVLYTGWFATRLPGTVSAYPVSPWILFH